MDPFAGLLGMPATQHPYIYGLNNPTRYTDPSGEFVLSAIGTALAVATIGGGLAAITEWGSQVIQGMQCGLSFLEATNYKNLDWGALANAFVNGYISTLLGGLVASILLGMSTMGLVPFLLGLGMSIGYGALASVLGDMLGCHVEWRINGVQPEGIYDPNTYLETAKWGGIFGGLGYGVGSILKAVKETAKSSAIAARQQKTASAASKAWCERMFYLADQGLEWNHSPGNDVLPANDLVAYAHHYWSQHPFVPKNFKELATIKNLFDTLDNVFDILLNDNVAEDIWYMLRQHTE